MSVILMTTPFYKASIFSAVARPNGQPGQAGVARGVRVRVRVRLLTK